jgi:hypothetical protein
MATPSAPNIYFRPLTLSNSLELYWYPPTNDANITSYIVECSNISYINVLPPTDRKTTIRNLVTGNSYVFTLKATNINGNGNIASFNLVMPGFKPDQPTNLDFTTNISNVSKFSTLNLNFNNPIYTGNSNLTYNVATMIPVDVNGNILENSQFKKNHSNEGTNNLDPFSYDDFNTNYNYKTYIQSINTVNSSDFKYYDNIINPSLPTNGLKLWLDPYDVSTITLSNSKVINWQDKSKNKANATVSESIAPTYDSSNSLINFNGNQYLNLPANTLPSANSSYSIFTYVSTNNITRNGQWFLYSGTPTANLSLGGFINSNSLVHSWWTNQNTSNLNLESNISYLIELTYSYAYTPDGYDAGIRRTYLNGTLVGQDNVSNKNSTSANNLIGTNSTFNGNLEGSIGDIIIYNRLLNPHERLSVKNYLERKKYNLSLHNFGNVITWLDASDPNNLYDANNEIKVSYNSKVFNWNDRSYANNNATQSNVSILPIRRPYIQNNLDVLEFNQSYLTIPSANYPIDAFIVMKLNSGSFANGIIGISPNSNNYSSLTYDTTWEIDATSNSVVSNVTDNAANFLLMEWSIGNNNNFIKRYGSNIANVTTGIWSLPNNSNIIIGNSNGFDFTKNFRGYIGEIIMFNRQLYDIERYQIEGYLAWKWGLQSFLNSNHPYKNSPPYLFYKFISNTFSPLNISGLGLWLDAMDNSSFVLSSNNITTWYDKSGNNYHATGVNNPQYTLNSYVSLNGTNQYFTLPNNALPYNNSAYSYFAIITFNTTGSNILFFGGSWGVDNSVFVWGTNTSNQTVTLWWGPDYGTDKTPFTNSQMTYLNNFYDGNGNRSMGISFDPNNVTVSQTSVVRTQTNNNNTIGSIVTSNQYLNGRIHELVVYNNKLSTINTQKIEGYLASKWGLQSNLPSNHPYKNLAPSVNTNFSPSIYSPWSWFDSSDTSTISLSGSNVTSIQNKGTNGVSITPQTIGQVTYNSSYTMNGKNLITVNTNTSLQLLNTNYTWSGSCIMVVVKYIQSSTGNKNSWFLFAGQFLPQVGLSNGYIEWGVNAIGYSARAISNNISANENVLLCLNVGGTTNIHNALGINGTNFTLTENNTTNGNNTTNWSVCLNVGGDWTVGPAVGIAEHIIFNRGLNTTERQEMEGYLAWKWGLQSNLPSNHPYKNSAP